MLNSGRNRFNGQSKINEIIIVWCTSAVPPPYFKSDSVNCVIKEKKNKKMLSYGTVHIHWRTYTRYVYIKMIYIYTHMEINKKNIYVVDSIESMIIYYMSN